MQPRRHLDARQDVFALADGGVIDPHTRVIDGRVHDAVGIGLRGPDIIIDRLGKGFSRCVEFENRHHFTRLRLLDQVVIVKAPVRRRIGAEALAGVAGLARRPWPDVENPHFENIAGLGIFDCDRAGQEVDADALARPADERALGRARAATGHGFLFPGPMKDGFGAGIVGDHALVIVIGVVRQRLDGRAIAGLQRQGRRDLLAEVTPVHGLW